MLLKCGFLWVEHRVLGCALVLIASSVCAGATDADEPLRVLGERYPGITENNMKYFFLDEYDSILDPLRHEATRIAEVGVWLGDGIRMWRDYFAQAKLFGFDTFDGTFGWGIYGPGDPQAAVFWNAVQEGREPRVELHKLNQSVTAELEALHKKFPNDFFDFIVDDGSHKMKDMAQTLAILFPLLRPGGVFAIEDLCSESAFGHYEQDPKYDQKLHGEQSILRLLQNAEEDLSAFAQSPFLTTAQAHFLEANVAWVHVVWKAVPKYVQECGVAFIKRKGELTRVPVHSGSDASASPNPEPTVPVVSSDAGRKSRLGLPIFAVADVQNHPALVTGLAELRRLERAVLVGPTFHEHAHVLAALLELTHARTYLEVGVYTGASCCLALQHSRPLELAILVDPSINPHLRANVKACNTHGTTVEEIPTQSQSPDAMEAVAYLVDSLDLSRPRTGAAPSGASFSPSEVAFAKNGAACLDVLYIDGAHDPQSATQDFEYYLPLVCSGGFILVDDYYSVDNPPVGIPNYKRVPGEDLSEAIEKVVEEHSEFLNVIGQLRNTAGSDFTDKYFSTGCPGHLECPAVRFDKPRMVSNFVVQKL
mmetsp:Transcript_12717/g.29227  ORF Transcript_12717/g.29227 Transcript_12717/m.29227 type:complete len:593 (+) Transcript_12717:67-1845(+)